MSEQRFDVEERWPELFEGLDEQTRHAVVQSLAADWHEGWSPDRDEVANLIEWSAGRIDDAEYERRAHHIVDRRHPTLERRGETAGPGSL